VVECDLAKVEVAGSNPVSRSRDSKALASVRGFAVQEADPPALLDLKGPHRERGAVAKW
jgi:hypothetical protein